MGGGPAPEGGTLVHARLLNHDGNLSSGGGEQADAVVVELNRCGVTNAFVTYIIVALLVLLIVFLGSGIGVAAKDRGAASVLVTLGEMCLVACLITCAVRFCAYCQHPSSLDE